LIRRSRGALTRATARRAKLIAADREGCNRPLELSRGHWGIENKLHWVCDVTFDEDRSQIRNCTGAHMMATLRNFAISLLPLAGATNIARAVRHCALNIARPLSFFGL